jgi:hypothetical protein
VAGQAEKEKVMERYTTGTGQVLWVHEARWCTALATDTAAVTKGAAGYEQC